MNQATVRVAPYLCVSVVTLCINCESASLPPDLPHAPATSEHMHIQEIFGAIPVYGPPMMAGDKVMHYAMNIGASTLMLSDAMHGQPDSLSARAYVYVPDVDAVCKKAAGVGMRCTASVLNEFDLSRCCICRDSSLRPVSYSVAEAVANTLWP